MSKTELRREIKRALDRLPPERLASVADFVQFLSRPSLNERVAAAEKSLTKGKGVNWRKVRADV